MSPQLTLACAPVPPAVQQVGDIVEGSVARIVQSTGVFLEHDGITSLLPMSAISHTHLRSIHKILRKGDRLKAIVVKVDAKRGLALSTKALEPKNGDMLKNRQLVFDKAEEMADAWRQKNAQKVEA
jgi:small subunit ribosomal protein S1